jgi:hypothetical protein
VASVSILVLRVTMRLLPAGVAAVSLLLDVSAIAAVSDPLARPDRNPSEGSSGAMLRGSNLDFGFPSSSELDSASKAFKK